jgi:hypothetical protein
MIVRYDNNCTVKNEKNGKEVDAVVMHFDEKKHLDVVINRAIKLHMVWNGQCYEGRAAGMDFISQGPAMFKTTTGIRG